MVLYLSMSNFAKATLDKLLFNSIGSPSEATICCGEVWWT